MFNNKASIIVPTFGNRKEWYERADSAVLSALNQTVNCEIVRKHAETLSEARNSGAEAAKCEWLCFLDADDQLDKRYIEEMLKVEGDIRRPATLGVYEDGKEDDRPVMIPRQNIKDTNFIVIGALIRKEDFLRVGGFRELPVLEDWDLFIRMYLEGAQIVDVPNAIYRVTVREGSRNRNQALHGKIYNEIKKRYFG